MHVAPKIQQKYEEVVLVNRTSCGRYFYLPAQAYITIVIITIIVIVIVFVVIIVAINTDVRPGKGGNRTFYCINNWLLFSIFCCSASLFCCLI